MRAAVGWLERAQVPLYLAAIAAGAAIGLLLPGANGLSVAINPVLGLLLYVTFLGIPFPALGAALRDRRFLGTVLFLNFVIVPFVVLALSRIVAHDRALLAGVLFVLLTPCIDYVVVFTGLAGGAAARLLAATPLLMLTQIALLPLYLWSMAGPQLARAIDLRPFIEAFVLLIVLPLVLAFLTQLVTRTGAGRAFRESASNTMVPLMMLTLLVVVASQIHGVSANLGSLALTVPVFVLFALVMIPAGLVTGRLTGLNAPARRAAVLSGTTRNSLVVLPLVLALPAAYAIAPLVVVTQTLTELIILVLLVRMLPRLDQR